MAVTVLTLALLWMVWPTDNLELAPPDDVAGLLDKLERGDLRAMREIRSYLSEHQGRQSPLIRRMLRHSHWQVRAGACRLMADEEAKYVGLLVRHAADRDWRVRSASFAALEAIQPFSDQLPMRNTPLDQREETLITWLEQYCQDRRIRLSDLWCDMFAETDRLDLGRPVIARCLVCHAGSEPKPPEANQPCAECHPAIHQQWKASAHANSLSHLVFTTVSPTTGQVESVDFAPLRGIGCRQCHRPMDSDETDSNDNSPDSRCLLGIGPVTKTYQVCVSCHPNTTEQWQAWRTTPQPHRADWPPGHIEFRPPASKTDCLTCHMSPENAVDENTFPKHDWSARRDLDLLQRGIGLQLVTDVDGKWHRFVKVTLINYAGHAYPTGSCRRALDLTVAGRGETDKMVSIIPAANCRESLPGGDPEPLGPGERRELRFPLTDGCRAVSYRLIYRRNRFDSDSFTQIIQTGNYKGM